MKSRRQGAILELVDREPLHSHEQLRRRLLREGFEATQATISRDIKELGLVKRAGDGAYQRPGVTTASPEMAMNALAHAAAEFVRRVDRVQQMLVIRTGAGQAGARWQSTAPGCRKPLARSLETTRSWWSPGTGAGRPRSSSGWSRSQGCDESSWYLAVSKARQPSSGCAINTGRNRGGHARPWPGANSKSSGTARWPSGRSARTCSILGTSSRDYVVPALRADALHEGGCRWRFALSRPLIARKVIEIADRARRCGPTRGTPRAGASQLDRLLAALAPALQVMTPARSWAVGSADLLAFARANGLGTAAADSARIESNFWGRSLRQPSSDAEPASLSPGRPRCARPSQRSWISPSFAACQRP
jgi:transcriptional regulator of arginine metabolism